MTPHTPSHSAVPSEEPESEHRPRIGHDVFTHREWRLLATHLDLSAREIDIVQGVFDGLPDKGIARRHGISSHTVHTYRWRLYRKLGVRNRCALIVRIFWQSRLLSSLSDSAQPPAP